MFLLPDAHPPALPRRYQPRCERKYPAEATGNALVMGGGQTADMNTLWLVLNEALPTLRIGGVA